MKLQAIITWTLFNILIKNFILNIKLLSENWSLANIDFFNRKIEK